MDEYIKQSINSRKEAIFNAYEVGAEAKKKIDTLFSEIEKLGKKCKDVGEFEAELLKSPLNQQYLDLFTEIATSTPVKGAPDMKDMKKIKRQTVGKMMVEGAALGAADRLAQDTKRAVLPTRAAVNQKIYDEARKVPGVSSALNISDKVSYAGHLGRLFASRKKKNKDS